MPVDRNGTFQRKSLEVLILLRGRDADGRGGRAPLAAEGHGATGRQEEGGSGVEPGLSFTPALWAHQRSQCGDGTNRRQENEACYEEKSTFHIVHRERSHDVTPLL